MLKCLLCDISGRPSANWCWHVYAISGRPSAVEGPGEWWDVLPMVNEILHGVCYIVGRPSAVEGPGEWWDVLPMVNEILHGVQSQIQLPHRPGQVRIIRTRRPMIIALLHQASPLARRSDYPCKLTSVDNDAISKYSPAKYSLIVVIHNMLNYSSSAPPPPHFCAWPPCLSVPPLMSPVKLSICLTILLLPCSTFNINICHVRYPLLDWLLGTCYVNYGLQDLVSWSATHVYMGCLKKTRNQCQPRGYNFDHDGCAQMYSNYIAKVILNNRPKTDFKYFFSLNNYRLANICKPCGYVRDTPQHVHH